MTVERLDPKTYDKLETLDHYARYVFAGQFVAGKRVLDIACGLGYGAKLLRDAGASHVVAIDHSNEAITYAKTHYGDERIDYYCADAHAAASAVDGTFDVIVSFETIEHLAQPDAFLGQCRRLAHHDTVFLLSVPNEAHLPLGFNPWHVHAFDAQSFATLLRKHFESFTLMPQYFSTTSVIDAVPDVEGTLLTLVHAIVARAQAIPVQPASYIAVCGPADEGCKPSCMVHGGRFFSDTAQWMEELEGTKTWLDEQRQTWMHIAEERATALTELECAKTWLDEQRQTWMHIAEERASALALRQEELQQVLKTVEMTERWAEQLLRARAWLMEQRESQETLIARQATQLTEQEKLLSHQTAQLTEQEKLLSHQTAQLTEQEATLARQATHLAEILAEAARCSEMLEALVRSRGYRVLGWCRTKLLPFGTWRGRVVRSLLRRIFRGLRPHTP